MQATLKRSKGRGKPVVRSAGNTSVSISMTIADRDMIDAWARRAKMDRSAFVVAAIRAYCAQNPTAMWVPFEDLPSQTKPTQ